MISSLIYNTCNIIKKGMNKVLIVPGLKRSFGECGQDVRISYDCDIRPAGNVYIGSHSQLGPHSLFWTTKAKIIIGEYVLFGPNVTIITGDHRTDVVGKHIIEVQDDDKLPENDADVKIEDGCWIGSNVTILKGVKLSEGCVIAAGSVVTKSTEAYCVYAGVPAKKLKSRFNEEELQKHKKILSSKKRNGN